MTMMPEPGGAGRGGHCSPPQFLADQLTLFQPGGTDYARLITTGTPGFSDLPTALLEMPLDDANTADSDLTLDHLNTNLDLEINVALGKF